MGKTEAVAQRGTPPLLTPELELMLVEAELARRARMTQILGRFAFMSAHEAREELQRVIEAGETPDWRLLARLLETEG